MKTAFWLSLGLVLYTYAGYPFVIWLLGRWFRKADVTSDVTPSVSIVMPVRNGKALLGWKIRHLLDLDYPNIEEIIVVSDGSTDGTPELLASVKDARMKAVILPEHSGKAVALNIGMAQARGDVILFVDLRPEITPGAVQRLVSHFADPYVGCVAGELLLSVHGQGAVTEAVGKFYWRYEQWIRKCEANFDSPVGVYGGFYAIRRELAVQQPEGTILDDMFQPLSIIRMGYRSVIEPSAFVFDWWPHKTGSEFARKVRTLAGNFQLIKRAPWILTRQNRVVFQFICHKMLRLIVPYLLLFALAASIVLSTRSQVYSVLAVIQAVGLLLAIAGLRFKIPVLDRIAGPAGAMLMLNAAAVVGLYKFLTDRRSLWRTWDPTCQQTFSGGSDVQSAATPGHA